MRTNEEIKTRLVKLLNEAGQELVTDILDCFCETTTEERVVGNLLREMRVEGTIRLIAAGDRSRYTPADLARCEAAIRSDNETFVLVELEVA